MRGGAQAHLLKDATGALYVVKFRNNPQHRRILINEFICSCFLEEVGITAPDTVLIEVTKELIEDTPAMNIQLASITIPIESGCHFGSKYPADPSGVAIYDFIPDSMLGMVNNLSHFLGVLAFDKWVSNADSRQAIFCIPPGMTPHRTKKYQAFMIDNGLAFNGGYWTHVNSPVQGLYARKQVYDSVVSLDDFEPWLDRIVHFPEAIIEQAFRQIPAEWFQDDACELQAFLETLVRRRKRVGDLIVDCVRIKSNPFPRWTVPG